jgi:hypothetical protein
MVDDVTGRDAFDRGIDKRGQDGGSRDQWGDARGVIATILEHDNDTRRVCQTREPRRGTARILGLGGEQNPGYRPLAIGIGRDPDINGMGAVRALHN